MTLLSGRPDAAGGAAVARWAHLPVQKGAVVSYSALDRLGQGRGGRAILSSFARCRHNHHPPLLASLLCHPLPASHCCRLSHPSATTGPRPSVAPQSLVTATLPAAAAVAHPLPDPAYVSRPPISPSRRHHRPRPLHCASLASASSSTAGPLSAAAFGTAESLESIESVCGQLAAAPLIDLIPDPTTLRAVVFSLPHFDSPCLRSAVSTSSRQPVHLLISTPVPVFSPAASASPYTSTRCF
jgi:hypothetical protein